jgi:predicted AAA+ superfamily ATPase
VGSVENLKDLGSVELLARRLPDLVGSPLSINSLREDLQVSHQTITKWLLALERSFAFFRLSPFGSVKLKAVKKEQKHYHYDWTQVSSKGARLENLVAVHLLKWCNYQEDTKGLDIELRYFRDITGREVDFILTIDKKPKIAIEVKNEETDISPSLIYFKNKFPECEAIQLTTSKDKEYVSDKGIRLVSVRSYLSSLI